ncbi:MAG TPA: copper oxidase, partial [Pseudomonadota bacterium]|nr:copper oxidase [Pseudomonadota bacterium]
MSTRQSEDNAGLSRRNLLVAGTSVATATLLARSSPAAAAEVPGAAQPRPYSAASTGQSRANQRALPPGLPKRDYTPVVVPNGAKLPWKVVDGVKVFHLIAEEV